MQDNSFLFLVDVSGCFFYAAGFLDFSFPGSMLSLFLLIVTSEHNVWNWSVLPWFIWGAQ